MAIAEPSIRLAPETESSPRILGGRDERDGRAPAYPRVSIVIPALNEAKNLPHVLARIPPGVHQVILVDGPSTDGTADVARTLFPGIHIIHQIGRGKGDALALGFKACTGDIVVMLDADGSTDAGELPIFVGALLAGADFAKGSRFLKEGGSKDITPIRRLGNFVLRGLVNLLYGTRYTDLCYGYNAFWTRHLPVINVDCDGFEVETLINVRVAKAGLRVLEVPSFESSRIHGESRLKARRDGLRVLRTIFAERFIHTARRPSARPVPAPAAPRSHLLERRCGFDRRSGEDRRRFRRASLQRRRGIGRRTSDGHVATLSSF